MPIIIAKKLTVGGATDTTYTINNFTTVSTELDAPVTAIGDIIQADNDAILISVTGPTMMITVEWYLVDEASTVVSGTGGTVTTAIDQMQYLYATFAPQGTNQFQNNYTLTLDFGGGETFARDGRVVKLNCVMTEQEPLTFKGIITFQAGTVS